MGNAWKGCSDEKLLESEIDLLIHNNKITREDILIENINLDGRADSQNYIHQITIKPKKEGLPKIVMIHGFGGGGAVFCNMIPYLCNYFEVILIDLLGMGASGRPEYECHTSEAAIDFHLDSIKAWMDR